MSPKPRRIRIQGLLEEDGRDLDLRLQGRPTILFGANGAGKSMALRLIACFWRLDLAGLSTIPFRSLRVDLETGPCLLAQRQAGLPSRLRLRLGEGPDDPTYEAPALLKPGETPPESIVAAWRRLPPLLHLTTASRLNLPSLEPGSRAEAIASALESLRPRLAPKGIRLSAAGELEFSSPQRKPLPWEAMSAGERALIHLTLSVQGGGLPPGSLILIDEPELSLHVEWAMRLGADLAGLARSRGVELLLATHSPYICEAGSPLMIRLGAPESESSRSTGVR